MEAVERKRTSFSADEKLELKKAHEEGMNSTSKDKLPQIQHLAKKLKRDDQEIKVVYS